MNADTITDRNHKRPGRPKGLGRVPGSGRKAGVPNKLTHDLKELILAKGKPAEYLINVVKGVKIRVGAPAGPGKAQYVYPTPEMRQDAAKFLLGRLIPAATSLEVTGGMRVENMSDFEAARRIAFILARSGYESGDAERQLDRPATLEAAAYFQPTVTQEPEPKAETDTDPASEPEPLPAPEPTPEPEPEPHWTWDEVPPGFVVEELCRNTWRVLRGESVVTFTDSRREGVAAAQRLARRMRDTRQ